MTPAKDSDNRVVVHLSTWLRVFAGISSLGLGGLSYALAYALAQGIGEYPESLVLFICVLPLTFVSIFFPGYTSQFIFDHTLGNMTIRSGVGPFTYRNRTFSKRDVLTVRVSKGTGQGEGVVPVTVTLWRMSLGISGRKRDLNITVNSQERAITLAERIRAFIESD